MATIHLRPGHVRPLWAGHPWVFAQAVDRVTGAPAPGDVVKVVDPEGKLLGRGYWSPKSAIPVRILDRGEDGSLDGAWLGLRIDEARSLRSGLLGLPNEATTGYRLINAEGDSLSGLVVDVYGDVAAVQIGTIGMKTRADAIFAHVERATGCSTVVEVPNRLQKVEGFDTEGGVVRGRPFDALRFLERGFELEVTAEITQKTGFYFDQRENRARVEAMSKGMRVLDVYSFIGAFGLAAARGGAEAVVCVDSSTKAMTAAAINAHHNGFAGTMAFDNENAKRSMELRIGRDERYDMVIVDPPKLAPTKRHLRNAQKAYRKLNANALSLVEPGGVLVSCSCSGVLSRDDFLRTLSVAGRDVGRDLSLLYFGQQAPDHPVPAAFPEGSYLKTAFLRVR